MKRGAAAAEVVSRHLRWLIEHRAQAIPLLLRLFEGEDEERLALATSVLKAMNDPALVPRLLELLQAPHVSDLAKGLLLNLLEHYGFDTCDPSLIAASINLRDALKAPGAP